MERTEKKNERLLSIDVGSGFTQYTDGGKIEGAFPSVVCNVPERLGFGADNAEIVEMEGFRYLVGEDAMAYGDPQTRANTLHDDWAGSGPWMALLVAALGRLEVKTGETIHLVTGLPQALYTERRDSLKAFLAGDKTFSIRGKKITIKILPEICPQATGALLYQASQDQSMLLGSVGVIDVGTYTTGYSVIDNTRFISSQSGGCPVGVSQLCSALQDHLSRDLGYNVDPAKLPKILLERSIRHRGEKIEVGEHIDRLALTVARPMLEKIHKAWQGGSSYLIFVAGGGAPFFSEAIKTVTPHAKVMSDSFYAVVRGMHCFLRERG